MLIITRPIGSDILIRDSLGNEMTIRILKVGMMKARVLINADKELFQVIKPERKE